VIALVQQRQGSRSWLLVAVAAAFTLGLTLTRANIAASLGAAGVVALVAGQGRVRNLVAIAPPAAAGVLAILIGVGALATGSVSPVSRPDLTPRSSAAPTPTPPPTVGEVVGGISDPFSDRNLQFRFAFWGEFANAIAARPLIGYGTGAAADGFDHFYAGTGRQNFEPHSIYFKAALEMGVPGLLVLLTTLGTAAWLALKRARQGDEAGMIGLGILVIVVVSGVTGPMLDAYPANLLVWASAGWCARIAAPERPR
jgi:O-antigen ligase